MKNTLPLIIAVVLGFAAVFMVSRLLSTGDDRGKQESTVQVVQVTRDFGRDDEVKIDRLAPRDIPLGALSPRHVKWSDKNMLVGQTVLRPIGKGDYLMLDNVISASSLGGIVATNEWAVPVTFSDTSLLPFLQPGDEIAILATFSVNKEIPSTDRSLPPTLVEERATSVVLPMVRILDVGRGDAMTGDMGMRPKTVIIAVQPQLAAMLIAAQQNAELYPVLRSKGDPFARNRLDVGVVDETTFENMRKGLEPVVVPNATE